MRQSNPPNLVTDRRLGGTLRGRGAAAAVLLAGPGDAVPDGLWRAVREDPLVRPGQALHALGRLRPRRLPRLPARDGHAHA